MEERNAYFPSPIFLSSLKNIVYRDAITRRRFREGGIEFNPRRFVKITRYPIITQELVTLVHKGLNRYRR